MSGAPPGSAIVGDRVRQLVAAALRDQPGRWWDVNELVEAVLDRAPGLSTDPEAHVVQSLRAARQAGAAWLAWRQEPRPSARARYGGGRRAGRAVFVYQWRGVVGSGQG